MEESFLKAGKKFVWKKPVSTGFTSETVLALKKKKSRIRR